MCGSVLRKPQKQIHLSTVFTKLGNTVCQSKWQWGFQTCKFQNSQKRKRLMLKLNFRKRTGWQGHRRHGKLLSGHQLTLFKTEPLDARSIQKLTINIWESITDGTP